MNTERIRIRIMIGAVDLLAPEPKGPGPFFKNVFTSVCPSLLCLYN